MSVSSANDVSPRQTDAMFNKYFQDRRIRRYLIGAGLVTASVGRGFDHLRVSRSIVMVIFCLRHTSKSIGHDVSRNSKWLVGSK